MTRYRACLGVALAWLVLADAAQGDTSGEQLAQGAGRALLATRAPALTLTTIDGQRIDLGRLYGRQAVYLKFWATWCVPCREQMPHFERTYRAAGPELAVIAINAGFNDSLQSVRAYRASLGLTMPIVLDDGRLAAAFHLRVTPQHVVIGRDGRVMYVGHRADARLDAALAAARASAPAPRVRQDAAPPPVRYRLAERLPARSLRLLDGGTMPLYEAGDSRATVLVFLSPWCESYLATSRPEVAADCRDLREQVATLGAEPGARVLGIASGLWATREDLRAYRRQYDVRIPLSLDASGAVFRAFGVSEVPALVVADASGHIRRTLQGHAIAGAVRAAIAAP